MNGRACQVVNRFVCTGLGLQTAAVTHGITSILIMPTRDILANFRGTKKLRLHILSKDTQDSHLFISAVDGGSRPRSHHA